MTTLYSLTYCRFGLVPTGKRELFLGEKLRFGCFDLTVDRLNYLYYSGVLYYMRNVSIADTEGVSLFFHLLASSNIICWKDSN